ncbi:KDPG and KHG aldolase [Agathobacter rectalis M104/1]|nr:KDPG and KHG aldolase [Agathobacter rectalis]CBK93006.1 KDPG and KHG aldolase [Agathobacter rectalis M104/1]
MNISESIEKLGVVPVVVLNDANDAKPLAKALCEGGCHVRRLPSVQRQQRIP